MWAEGLDHGLMYEYEGVVSGRYLDVGCPSGDGVLARGIGLVFLGVERHARRIKPSGSVNGTWFCGHCVYRACAW